jgi:hypothetical protein
MPGMPTIARIYEEFEKGGVGIFFQALFSIIDNREYRIVKYMYPGMAEQPVPSGVLLQAMLPQ